MDSWTLLIWVLVRPLALLTFAFHLVLLDVTRLSPRRQGHLLCAVSMVALAATVDGRGEAVGKAVLGVAMVALYVAVARRQDSGEEPPELSEQPAGLAIVGGVATVVGFWMVFGHLAWDIANGGSFDEGWICPAAFWMALLSGSDGGGGGKRASWRSVVTPPERGDAAGRPAWLPTQGRP